MGLRMEEPIRIASVHMKEIVDREKDKVFEIG